jgi:hypothetical protein
LADGLEAGFTVSFFASFFAGAFLLAKCCLVSTSERVLRGREA